jgi:toxin ParE1/3/4
MRVLRIHAAAAEEAAEAAAWYEKERPGLGADFEHAADAALDVLEQDVVPLTSLPGVAGARGVKRLILRRFPYAVIVLERDTEIVVIAFSHHARRPGYWRDRLRT